MFNFLRKPRTLQDNARIPMYVLSFSFDFLCFLAFQNMLFFYLTKIHTAEKKHKLVFDIPRMWPKTGRRGAVRHISDCKIHRTGTPDHFQALTRPKTNVNKSKPTEICEKNSKSTDELR